MSLDDLMDGACGAVVMVRADALRVAEALGRAEALVVDGQRQAGSAPENWRAVVLQPADSEWSLVELPQSFDDHSDEIDSGPMLDDAALFLAGMPSERKPTYGAPLTTAATLGARLEVDSIGIWGSDQGEAVGGVGFFAAGQLVRAASGLSPELARKLYDAHHSEDDDEGDAVRQAIVEFADGAHFFYAEGKGHRVEGDLVEVVDEAVTAAALDPEWWGAELPQDWAAGVVSGHVDPATLTALWFVL